jgi:hypothetical protein
MLRSAGSTYARSYASGRPVTAWRRDGHAIRRRCGVGMSVAVAIDGLHSPLSISPFVDSTPWDVVQACTGFDWMGVYPPFVVGLIFQLQLLVWWHLFGVFYFGIIAPLMFQSGPQALTHPLTHPLAHLP